MSSFKLLRAGADVSKLKETIAAGKILRASQDWGGANVVVSSTFLSSGYREVVTPHSLEVSWLFEQFRDIFRGLIDAGSKFEFYGRLEITANRSIAVGKGEVPEIGLAMIEAAEAMLNEMSRREFRVLLVAEGPEISADRLAP